MYRIFVCLFLLFTLTTISYGQEREGIRFFQGSWKELLAEAQRSHKPIFVDVYTDWCVPCKRMEREVLCYLKLS